MKAITIHQPYALLIIAGVKGSETRSWAPPDDLIGERIAIHASAQEVALPLEEADIAKADAPIRAILENGLADPGEDLPAGAVLGSARIAAVGTVTRHFPKGEGQMMAQLEIRDAEGGIRRGNVPIDGLGDYEKGRSIWLLDDICRFEKPKPAKGAQKLWEWSGRDEYQPPEEPEPELAAEADQDPAEDQASENREEGTEDAREEEDAASDAGEPEKSA